MRLNASSESFLQTSGWGEGEEGRAALAKCSVLTLRAVLQELSKNIYYPHPKKGGHNLL